MFYAYIRTCVFGLKRVGRLRRVDTKIDPHLDRADIPNAVRTALLRLRFDAKTIGFRFSKKSAVCARYFRADLGKRMPNVGGTQRYFDNACIDAQIATNVGQVFSDNCVSLRVESPVSNCFDDLETPCFERFMPVTVACESCGAKFAVPDLGPERIVICPVCKENCATANSSLDGKSKVPYAKPFVPPPAIASAPMWQPVEQGMLRGKDLVEVPDDPQVERPSRRVVWSQHDGRNDEPMFKCPYCGFDGMPYVRSKVSGSGWVVFVLLLLFVCPFLCWIGLLIKDDYRVCSCCGMKLG